MAAKGVPEAAQQRIRQLVAARELSRRDLFRFVEGLLLGMGLAPDDWELDTATMVLHRQESHEQGVYTNATEDKR